MTREEAKRLKPGDIVWYEGCLYFVSRGGDEYEAELYMDGDYCWVRSSELKLVCAVEDRTDHKSRPAAARVSSSGVTRPAAGEPGSVSRRRGNLGTAEIGGEA